MQQQAAALHYCLINTILVFQLVFFVPGPNFSSIDKNLTMYKTNEDQENEIPIYDERQNQYLNSNVNNTHRMTEANDARNLCFSCKGPINGQVITALGYLWHPNHFVCFH